MQITQNGLARSVIVTGKKATWLERHAAEELRDYIEKISGAALLVVVLAFACLGSLARALASARSSQR